MLVVLPPSGKFFAGAYVYVNVRLPTAMNIMFSVFFFSLQPLLYLYILYIKIRIEAGFTMNVSKLKLHFIAKLSVEVFLGKV